jgi:hypothetical protein
MVLRVWQFACKAHVDLKRVYSRFGYSVGNTTSRNAINSMTAASMVELRENVLAATERGQTEGCTVIDNCQAYSEVYEQGIGRQNQLKVGTAATYVYLQDCAPGAFDAQPYYDKVALQERKTLTTDSLFDDIDWEHLRVVIPLHWTRVLVEFIPELQHLAKEIIQMFRERPVAIRRMREDRQTKCQGLGTNSEHSTETQGMERAVRDFDMQTGISIDNPGDLLSWLRGDGASYAGFLRLIKYCAPLGKFKNKIATPEIWHEGYTELNSTAHNHYGPATSSNPSSLSRSSNIAGLKRPSNTKSCDYYPTVRNLTLIWTAHVLNCWRYVASLFFGSPHSNFGTESTLRPTIFRSTCATSPPRKSYRIYRRFSGFQWYSLTDTPHSLQFAPLSPNPSLPIQNAATKFPRAANGFSRVRHGQRK